VIDKDALQSFQRGRLTEPSYSKNDGAEAERDEQYDAVLQNEISHCRRTRVSVLQPKQAGMISSETTKRKKGWIYCGDIVRRPSNTRLSRLPVAVVCFKP